MRKTITLFIILLVIFALSCQQQPEPVDLEATKTAITAKLDELNSAFKAKDINAIKPLLADDGLFCGTDPGEFWDKEGVLIVLPGSMEQVGDYTIDKREIKVGSDGNSGIAVEQFTMKMFSPNIPVRAVYNCKKTGNEWKFDFINWSMIPYNADISKLNDALK